MRVAALSWGLMILLGSVSTAEAQTSLKDLIDFAAGGQNDVQNQAYNAQTLAARQRVLNADSDRELAFQIANSKMIQHFKLGDPADFSEALYSMDVVAAYDDNPELTLRLLKPHGNSLFSIRDKRDELVSVYPLKISPVTTANDSAYRVEFQIMSFSKGPFFWRGERLPEKNAAVMTRQQLDDIAAMRLAEMASDGSLEAIDMRLRALAHVDRGLQ